MYKLILASIFIRVKEWCKVLEMKLIERIVKNIDLKRKEKEWSVDRLAREAGMPVATLNTIRQMQNDDMKLSKFIALAKALDTSLDDLIK